MDGFQIARVKLEIHSLVELRFCLPFTIGTEQTQLERGVHNLHAVDNETLQCTYLCVPSWDFLVCLYLNPATLL